MTALQDRNAFAAFPMKLVIDSPNRVESGQGTDLQEVLHYFRDLMHRFYAGYVAEPGSFGGPTPLLSSKYLVTPVDIKLSRM